MEVQEICHILQKEIHTVIMATNDETGRPVTCAIDLMLLKEDKLYFLTAKGKMFYQRLIHNQYVAFTGLKGSDTLSAVAISIKGRIRNIGNRLLDEIFDENPYMKEIYPDKGSRDVLDVFELYEYEGEYFDLSTKPITRKSFSVGMETMEEVYVVNDACTGCMTCQRVCPQKCIDTSILPVMIQQMHCLHCGKCAMVCPVKAITKSRRKQQ